jgi:hypothetical protein
MVARDAISWATAFLILANARGDFSWISPLPIFCVRFWPEADEHQIALPAVQPSSDCHGTAFPSHLPNADLVLFPDRRF